MKKDRSHPFLKVLAFSNILVGVFFIVYVFSTKLLLKEAGLIFLLLEIPIILYEFAFIVFRVRRTKVLTAVVSAIQILIIGLLLIPSTQNQIFHISYKGSFGNSVSNTYIKWASRTPLEIFKSDYRAPTMYMNSPISGYCIIELGERCKIVTGNITISADVTDNIAVKIVKIYIDEDLIKEFSTSPYETTWDSSKVSKGYHSIKIFAEDAAGNYTENTTEIDVKSY